MNEEQRSWQEHLPEGEEICPVCYTSTGLLAAWQAAEAAYQRQMDPTQHDGKPDRKVKDAKHALMTAFHRRKDCPERHGENG